MRASTVGRPCEACRYSVRAEVSVVVDNVHVGCRERLVSKVGIVRKGKGEFSVAKVVGRGRAVVEPLEEVSPRE